MRLEQLDGAWKQIMWTAENAAASGNLDALTGLLERFDRYRQTVDILHQRCQRGFYLNG